MNRGILAKLVGLSLLFSVAVFNLRSSFAQGAGLATANQSFDAPQSEARGLLRIDTERRF